MVLRVHPELPLLALGRLLDDDEARAAMARLCVEVPWSDGSYVATGRRFSLPRRQAWFADPGVAYRYAANLLNSHPWTPLLQALKGRVENASGHRFNAVLANLYPDGHASVGWHADDEPDLGPAPVIASLSLGASRTFRLRSRMAAGRVPDQGETRLILESGTLLLMMPPLQSEWEHAVLSEAGIDQPRINLTFRQVLPVLHPK